MAVKLSKTQLPQLLSWLQEHLPRSFKIHGELKSHLKDQANEMDFFVDSWPQPQAAIALLKSAREQVLGDRVIVIGVFGLKDEALIELLKNPSAVSWDAGVAVCVPVRLKPALVALAQEIGKSTTLFPSTLLKATSQDLKPIPVPEGMKFQPISSADIKVIHSTWRHGGLVRESYVEESLRRFPSVYLVTDDGQHVGHMLGTSDSTMGMLYVNPEFRRRGYAKVIVTQLAQKYFDQGEDAHVYIEDYNSSSLKLHTSLGFKAASDESEIVFILYD